MGSRGVFEMGMVLALVVMSWNGAMGQSGCTSAITGLSPCLNYVTGNSSTPSSTCCSQLASVVQSSPQCLCSLLSGAGAPNLGININQTLALSLPGACNVNTPPVGQCNAAANGPSASTPGPIGSPTADASETPDEDGSVSPSGSEVPSASSGGAGSKTVPTTNNGNTSDASIVSRPLHFVILLFLLIASASTVTKF